ncbi:LysR family transcriptional regulator [Microbacterium sp. MEC084]|nr:hypothetical protein ASD19_00155 [Microbacterium sp. Root53]MCD1269384.1 LysR family transcriptional regulator [Microbacterium sp. MEC084]
MDSRQLRYFSVLAETCHFGHAAQTLHVTPSALSQAMRQLEAELNVVLFHRTTRRVTLTPAGLWLQEEAAQILSRLHGATLAIRRFSTGAAGKLGLGFTGTSGFAYLPRMAQTLRTALTGVDLSFRVEMLTPQQCEHCARARSTSGSCALPPWVRTSRRSRSPRSRCSWHSRPLIPWLISRT